jgi:hypothetical protein
MREPRFLRVTGAAAGAELRAATFEGREHVVVPVIALLGDVVVRPLGSAGPEFVPAAELASAPGGWNGRPVVPDHPEGGTANEPHTLERQAFGRLFGTRFEGGKLRTEAWLDPERAAKVGAEAQRVIDRCRAGETVEVSVGAWVVAEKRSGTAPDGTPYDYVWHDVVPDHLAMLPEGTTGACSISMGCGAPRAAKGVEMPEAKDEKPRGILSRFLQSFGLRGAAEDDGVSDRELRDALASALRTVEPGFDWIEEVFPDAGVVIYTALTDRKVLWFRRTFSKNEAGEVTLNDDRSQVEPILRYEPVKAAEAEPEKPVAAARAACDCHDKGDAAQGEPMSKTKDLVGRLIANERSPFTDKDTAALSALSEESLAALDQQFAAPAPAPAKTEEPKEEQPKPAADPQAVTLSREEYDDMRAASSAFRAQQLARKGALVAKLKGAQDTYTEAELQAMAVEQLEKTAKLLKVDEPRPDYSLQGEPGSGIATLASFAPPDPYGLNKKEAN